MPKPYRFTNVRRGRATVVSRSSGDVVGTVAARSKSYNLRRYLVSRWWDAITPGGVTVGKPATRGEAALLLLEHAKLTPAGLAVAEALHRHDAQSPRTIPIVIRLLREAFEAHDLGLPLPREDTFTADIEPLWAWVRTQRPTEDTP